MLSKFGIMASILQGMILLLCLIYATIGYYRRQAGYRLVGGECLQWRYLVRQLARVDSLDKGTGRVEIDSDIYSQAIVRVLVKCMSGLERSANCSDKNSAKQWLSLFLLHIIDVMIGLSVKIFLILYAIIRWICSVELYTFNESRRQKWQGFDYNEFRRTATRRYKIVYIRHGESMWNKLFNRGLSFEGVERFVTGIFDEVLKATEMDSQILDSPLSSVGVDQASELSAWVVGSGSHFTDAYTEKCCFLTSNLRRAIGTILIGFGRRVSSHNSIRVLSCLQELTRNPDSISYAFAHNSTPLDLFGTPEVPEEVVHIASSKLNWIDHKGNRGLFDHIEDRFQELISYCDRVYDKENIKIFIISGHSLYLKKLLQFYLPPNTNEPGVSRKISNCGILQFDLLASSCYDEQHQSKETWRSPRRRVHCIDNKTVELVKGRYL